MDHEDTPKLYSSPLLVEYGTIVELTAADSGTDCDNPEENAYETSC